MHIFFLCSEGKQERESKINVNNIIRKGRDDDSDGRKEREKGRNQEYTEGKEETK